MRPLFASAITAFPLIALGACLFDGPSETPSDAGISPIEAGRDVLDPGDAQEAAAPVAAAVGPAGGEVASTDGARVVVPVGAVANNVIITLAPTTPPPNNTGVVGTVASPAVRLGPEGQSFTVPVFVTLPIDLARLPAGTTVADLRIFRAPAGTGAFEAIPTGVVGNGTALTAATTHFSDFVVALPSSPGPACFDATKNGSETDTDCGGACNACEDGKACISAADCRGFSCNSGVCATGIKAVALGKFHSCVVLSDGRLKCWGLGAFRTGSGGPDPVGGSTATMGGALAAVDLGGRKAVDVAVGQQHTCVLLEGGEVACWGAGGSLLGVGDTRDRGGDPGDFGAFLGLATFGIGRKATAISFGASHGCALLDNGQVKCWGANQDGQLGLGDTETRGDAPGEMGDALPAVPLGSGRSARQVVALDRATCALLDNGQVKCCGDAPGYGVRQARGDEPGELGDALPAVDLGTGRTATAIAGRLGGMCAVLDDGTLKCWGDFVPGVGDANARGFAGGEMGDALLAIPLGGGVVTGISHGFTHVCATFAGGAAKCWGRNSQGQLGLGDTQDRGLLPGEMGASLPPISLPAGRTAAKIFASLGGAIASPNVGTVGHTCALLDNSRLACWGFDANGQTGVTDTGKHGAAAGTMGDALPIVPVF